MSSAPARMDAAESSRELLTAFTKSLVEVLEAMTDQHPSAAWEAVDGAWSEVSTGNTTETLWWEQSFQILPEPVLWVGATQAVWEELGGRTLRAAGIEEVELADARHTWMEILSQALSSVARAASTRCGTEVTCSTGSETAPPASVSQWARVRVSFESELEPVWVAVAPVLLERLAGAGKEPPAAAGPAAAGEPSTELDPDPQTAHPPVAGRTLDLLLDVELPVSISFGRTQIPLRDVLKLTTGSIVELNRGIGESVDVLVNHSLIARGEVVVIDGNYGVRIQEIVKPFDRLRSIR